MRNLIKWTGRAAAIPALMLLLSLGAGAEPGDVTVRALYHQGGVELENWDFASARGTLEKMYEAAAESGDPEDMARTYVFEGHYHFFKGDYAASKEALEKAEAIRELDRAGSALKERTDYLSGLWEDSGTVESRNFTLRYVNERDKVLGERSLETLERGLAALGPDIRVSVEAPVLVEVYPAFEAFSNATGLSMEALENSGTIAVCKYRRIMINSPRITVRGYAYRDTLSHELVHFLVYEKFGETIPIWLHEGLAKHQELRWRKDTGGWLTPGQRSLLASALKHDEFISFERMSPSFAYFETPRQGQLAFAEVATVIDYIIARKGWSGVLELCGELSRGADYREGLRKVTGLGFEDFWEDWKRYARTLGFEEIPGMEISVYEIRKGDEEIEEVDDEVSEEDLNEGEQWKYVRLGDLLRDRGHFSAAAVEYERARELSPYSPRILNKIGLAYFLAEDYDKSIEPLRLGIELYPTYSTTHVNLGRALLARGETDAAWEAFQAVLDINPFNPIAYEYLITIAGKKGDDESLEKLRADYEIIGG